MNPLRTILSLLGVTVGIFSVIGVLTFVDSLERSLKDSFDFLGANVIYMEKWPYGFTDDYPWWKYMQRPQATYDEYKFLESYIENSSGISIFAVKGNTTAKRASNSIRGIAVLGVTFGHSDVIDMPIEDGRYFAFHEVEYSRNVALIGINVAEALFPDEDPLGKEIKISNAKYQVIGVMKRQGENIIGAPSNDDACFIPYKAFNKMFYTGGFFGINSRVAVKGTEADEGLLELEGEMTGLMRRKRGLKPKDENNFALNRPEAIADQISIIFGALTWAGWIIGGFAMLVGGFGIANIMFVSVKERTGIIGIQKSLGAKNYFVLLQFLFEAIFLCIVGGLAGLLFVYAITFIPMGTFEVILTAKNIILGLVVASVVGILSGIIPAAVAARMDPVIAIRSS